jgi:hypothetical protein
MTDTKQWFSPTNSQTLILLSTGSLCLSFGHVRRLNWNTHMRSRTPYHTLGPPNRKAHIFYMWLSYENYRNTWSQPYSHRYCHLLDTSSFRVRFISKSSFYFEVKKNIRRNILYILLYILIRAARTLEGSPRAIATAIYLTRTEIILTALRGLSFWSVRSDSGNKKISGLSY